MGNSKSLQAKIKDGHQVTLNTGSQNTSLIPNRKRDRKEEDNSPLEDITVLLMNENSSAKKRKTDSNSTSLISSQPTVLGIGQGQNEEEGHKEDMDKGRNPTMSSTLISQPGNHSVSSMPSISSMPSLHIVGLSNISKNSSSIDLEDPFVAK